MIIPQLIAIALLIHWNLQVYAGLIMFLVVFQAALMQRLIKDPRGPARYNVTGTTFMYSAC